MQEDLTVGLFFSDYEYTNYWDNYRLFFLLSQSISSPQAVRDLGKPREFSAVGFLFLCARRRMPSPSPAGCIWNSSVSVSCSVAPSHHIIVLLGESQEGGTISEGEMMLGQRPRQRLVKQRTKQRGSMKDGCIHRDCFSLTACPCILHSPPNMSRATFLFIKFYLFSLHILHSYRITHKPMNSCSFVLLPLHLLN